MSFKFLDTIKKQNPGQWSLKWHLHKRIAGEDLPRSPKTVHASQLDADKDPLCARYRAYLDLKQVEEKARWVNTSPAVTFHIGRVLQESVLELWLPHMVMTDWKCRMCGFVFQFRKRPGYCEHCNYSKFEALEMRFTSLESGVSGGIDFVADFGSLPYRVVEIKTMDKEEFKELKAPLAQHKLRTNLYMRLIEESDSPYKDAINIQQATILYISKGGWGCKDEQITQQWKLRDAAFSPFKEFSVDRDDVATEPYLKHPRLLKAWRENKGELPERLCCDEHDKRGKYCPAYKLCFGGVTP